MNSLRQTVLLVVEGDKDIREALAELLTQEGYSVVQTGGVRKAWQEALAALPDLVLLDLMMPGAAGWDLLDWRQSHPDLQAVPVLVISAVPPERQRLAPFPGVSTLLKPATPQRLLDAVQLICSAAVSRGG